jgi:hypothetical protein
MFTCHVQTAGGLQLVMKKHPFVVAVKLMVPPFACRVDIDEPGQHLTWPTCGQGTSHGCASAVGAEAKRLAAARPVVASTELNHR